jgi:pSer/pThr/pTyr-binding forkhead associated (FHA) protein
VYLVVPPGGSFRETRRIELGPRALVLGRAETCDVRVDVPGVDQEHAKISEVALIAIGPDCAVGDVPLDPGARRLVTPGDEIQIGSVVVALEGDGDRDPAKDTHTIEAEILGKKRAQGPCIRVVEGSNNGEELVLKEEGREYLVGRGASCDLVLEDREVSREHVKLVRRGFAIYVQDLSSTRGSWLGRSSVYSGSLMEWARPRMLRVGATVLSLELPEELRRVAPQAMASAPMTPPPRSRGGAALAAGALPPAAPSSPAPVSLRGGDVPPPVSSIPNAPYSPHSPHSAPPPSGFAPSGGAAYADAAASAGALAPLPPSMPGSAAPLPRRTAWKKSSITLGRASGILLLALAALAILGGLFVVFSLLE